jgi:flagellar biosynthesis/type III secretory pathway protein FliH
MMMRLAKDALAAPVLALSNAPLADALHAHHERASVLAGLEDELVALLLRALARLVEDELRLAPEHVRAIARAELERLGRAHRATLHVHPEDVCHVSCLLEENMTASLTLEADPTLARGDCVLVSEIGTVDARIQTRIDRLGALINEGHVR